MSNVVEGTVEPPAPGDVLPLPERGTPEHEPLEALGAARSERGEVGLVCSPAGWRRVWGAS